jgi:plastocyanin
MPEIKMLDRRTFTLEAALAVLSGVAITISPGCGGGSSPTTPSTPAPTPAPTPTPAGTDKTGSISANHGHTAVITGAQLTAGVGFTLTFAGSASHTHSVQLSNAEIAAIAANQRVSKESTNNDGHEHTVTFN